MSTTNLIEPAFDLYTFFEMTPDLVCIADKAGYFKKVNQAVINKLGYSQEELFAQPISSFIHPQDKHLTSYRRANLLNGKALLNFENRYIAKSGKIVWLEWSSVYISDKEIVFAIAKDITERKKVEMEVEEKFKRARNLATHFKSSIEDDRKYLATELHEELAQLAAVIKMDVEWINDHTEGLPELSRERVEHSLAVAELLMKTIRRISFVISPGMLTDLGLGTTLEWQCKEFSILNGITCHFESEYDEARLSEEIKIDLFRICQEALTNIMHHALANNVVVSVIEVDDTIILTINDDGEGFEASQLKKTAGLVRMRERAASINGRLDIESKAGIGTRISVTIEI